MKSAQTKTKQKVLQKNKYEITFLGGQQIQSMKLGLECGWYTQRDVFGEK